MRTENITGRRGNKIPNQFLMTDEGRGANGNFLKREVFQSYDSVIAIKTLWKDGEKIELDEKYWDYSRTTGKYRNIFLGETKKETEQKIKAGIYKLANLN
jgi:hypothetical protein